MAAVKQVNVGKPPAEFPIEEDRVEVHFHEFENLTTRKGAAVKSSTFTCAGHEWNVWLYPGGDTSSEDGMIGVYLPNSLPDLTLYARTRMAAASRLVLLVKSNIHCQLNTILIVGAGKGLSCVIVF